MSNSSGSVALSELFSKAAGVSIPKQVQVQLPYQQLLSVLSGIKKSLTIDYVPAEDIQKVKEFVEPFIQRLEESAGTKRDRFLMLNIRSELGSHEFILTASLPALLH